MAGHSAACCRGIVSTVSGQHAAPRYPWPTAEETIACVTLLPIGALG